MKPLQSAVALLTVAALYLFGGLPRAAAEDLSPQDLYMKVVKSCVYIITPLEGGFAEGSGSLIDVDEKLVLTNYHVVDDADKVDVQFPIYDKKGQIITDKGTYKKRIPLGQSIPGTVLFRDKTRDLALVRLDSVPAGMTAIPLAKTSVRANTTVWQIGNAGAVEQVFRVSKGEVSTVAIENFKVGMGGGKVLDLKARMVTATTPTNAGDSGGPLFDKRGYQVAVTESGNRIASLVNRFVDITEVRDFLKQKKMTIKELSDEPDPGPKTDPKLKTPPKTDPKKDDPTGEQAAADNLKRAMLFATGEDNRPIYIAKLTEIVKKWPNTEAGKEAKKRLAALK